MSRAKVLYNTRLRVLVCLVAIAATWALHGWVCLTLLAPPAYWQLFILSSTNVSVGFIVIFLTRSPSVGLSWALAKLSSKKEEALHE